jgi:predicted permease
MVLAGAAGLVGLALSVAGVRAFEIAIADTGVPYWLKLEMDYRVFAFLAATSLGSSLVFGLTPAFHTWRSGVAGLLRSSAGSIASRHTRRWTGAVVVAQFALAVVLLAGAGLMMRTLLAALAVDSGVATRNLAYMRIALPAARYRAPATRATFYRELQDRLFMAPGATDAALASDAPRTGGRLWAIVPDGDAGPRDDRLRVTSVDVGRGYFETVGATLLRGRTFTAADRGTGHAAAIINARLMETYFRGTDPIGRTIRLSDADAAGVQLQPLTIVGVVSNVRQLFSTAENHLDGPLPFDAVVYLPIEFTAPAGASVLVRTASPAAVASVVRQQVAMMDPDVAIYEVQTVDDWIAFRQWPQRVFGSVFAVFACIAVLLAAIGLYGVTACDVARRTREIGVRVALGARRTDVARLVGTQAAIHLALGAALGVAGAIAVNRLLQLPLDLVSVRTTDPFALGGTALVLLSAAAIAIWLPTRRAVRLDPAAALRAE